MAAAVITWHPSSPESLDADLAGLWRDLATEGPLVRALMSNLVVVREPHDGDIEPGRNQDSEAWSPDPQTSEAVASVAERHPVRGVILEYIRGATTACAPSAARVGLLTFGTPPARCGVELIGVRAACAEPSIPSIVRRLTHGDVPTTVWWIGDLSRTSIPPAVARIGRQFVYDSASWADAHEGFRTVARLLALAHRPDISDLQWRRLATMRRAVVHAIRAEPNARTILPGHARIEHRRACASGAWLLAGWLGARLGWPHATLPIVDETDESDEDLTVALEGQGWSIRASKVGERVTVVGGGGPPFELLGPREREAEGVAAEMQSLGYDTALQDAVRAVARHAGLGPLS